MGKFIPSEEVQLIRRIPINNRIQDRWLWHFEKSGLYTVRSGYKVFLESFIREASPSCNSVEQIWKKIWSLEVPRKIKFFCWRAFHEIIPTNLNLKNRGINIEPFCPRCNNSFESTDHALFGYNQIKPLWRKIVSSELLTAEFNGCIRDRWLALCSACKPNELNIIAITCWANWNDRNNQRLGKPFPSIDFRRDWILKYFDHFQRSASNPRKSESERPKKDLTFVPNWTPPPLNFCKLNVDAAWKSGIPQTGISAILRNSEGILLGVEAKSIDLDFPPPLAEAFAIKEGLHFAASLGCPLSNLTAWKF